MTPKQIQFATTRPRQAPQTMEDYSCEYRRSTSESSNPQDLNRMAIQSSRARLISQLVGQPDLYPSEFASFFHGPSRNTEPLYSATSHTKKFATKKLPVIPAYPSLVHALRRYPYVETTDDDIRANEERNSKCKCANCAMRNCCNRVYQKSVGFRDNIMTFNDQCTMTPKVRDASCCCAKNAPTTSEVSVCVSDVAVKDTYIPLQYVTQKCSPIPILKKSYKDFGTINASNECSDDYQEVVRDVEFNVDMKPKNSRSIKSFLRLWSKDHGSSRHDICPRVNIYNEGISDSIANHLPVTPKTVPTPVNVKTECSRIESNTPSFTDTDVFIPYSHRFESKYHGSCKKSSRNYHDADPDVARNPVAGPMVVGQAWKPVNVHHRPPPQCIKLPKKVLTSERNIETFISKAKPKFLPQKR